MKREAGEIHRCRLWDRVLEAPKAGLQESTNVVRPGCPLGAGLTQECHCLLPRFPPPAIAEQIHRRDKFLWILSEEAAAQLRVERFTQGCPRDIQAPESNGRAGWVTAFRFL